MWRVIGYNLNFQFYRGVPLGTTPSGHEDIGWTYKIDNVDYTAIRSIPVWPIRAKYGNYFVPGKLVGDPVRAYLPWGGGEVKVTQFEVNFYWKKTHFKDILKFTN